ncbi:hypothetical protein J6590_016630 [Homalodisca vitripennis]|nr:hypothetical protein J6590_016630 [Homalodisca vitripennis]
MKSITRAVRVRVCLRVRGDSRESWQSMHLRNLGSSRIKLRFPSSATGLFALRAPCSVTDETTALTALRGLCCATGSTASRAVNHAPRSRADDFDCFWFQVYWCEKNSENVTQNTKCIFSYSSSTTSGVVKVSFMNICDCLFVRVVTQLSQRETNAKSNILQHCGDYPTFSVLYRAHKCDSDSRETNAKSNILQHWVGLPNFQRPIVHTNVIVTAGETNAKSNISNTGWIPNFSASSIVHTNVIVTAGETNAKSNIPPTLGGITQLSQRPLLRTHKCDSDSREKPTQNPTFSNIGWITQLSASSIVHTNVIVTAGETNAKSNILQQWVGYPTFSASSIVHTNVIVTAGETNAKSNILQHWVGLPNFLSEKPTQNPTFSNTGWDYPTFSASSIVHTNVIVTAGETNAKSNILQHWVGLPNFLSLVLRNSRNELDHDIFRHFLSTPEDKNKVQLDSSNSGGPGQEGSVIRIWPLGSMTFRYTLAGFLQFQFPEIYPRINENRSVEQRVNDPARRERVPRPT